MSHILSVCVVNYANVCALVSTCDSGRSLGSQMFFTPIVPANNVCQRVCMIIYYSQVLEVLS